MSDEIFLDTSVMAYAFDEGETKKRRIAMEIVSSIFEKKIKGTLSNQILLELFLVLTRKMKPPLTKEMASDIVKELIRSDGWKKVNYTYKTVHDALDIVEFHNVSLTDAIIARTAIENKVTKIFTENEREFSRIPNIKVVNPFKD